MKEYMEQVLHQSIDETPYKNKKALPIVCHNAFELGVIRIGEQNFILAAPKYSMNLSELRKMRIQLERHTGYICAFYLKKLNWYSAPKMIEEGIPFVYEGRQIYLPFLGILLDSNAERTPEPCAKISFLTQKLLLKALYEGWKGVTAAQAAEKLDVSRMSITRCYDEIEALGMPFFTKQHRSRKFNSPEDKKVMWNTIRPFLRNPVIKTFRYDKKPHADMTLSGTSALAEYSSLEESRVSTYAICKAYIGALQLNRIQEVPANEEPNYIIQELGYYLPFKDEKAIDPLSLSLTITKEELADPRVEMCINEMLEELVW